MKKQFILYPVGIVHKKGSTVKIEIFDEFKEALHGLEGFSHMDVFFWFDRNDMPEKRKIMKVHPRNNQQNPLTGIFATHSPMRPNLIGVTVCKILAVSENTIFVEAIDAFDKSPVIDIKCHNPGSLPEESIKTPDWIKPHNPF